MQAMHVHHVGCAKCAGCHAGLVMYQVICHYTQGVSIYRLPFAPMAEVKLETTHVIHCNKKKWVIAQALLDDGWLQISASCYGLCNLLSEGTVGRQPSLKNSTGLQSLIQKRLDKLNEPDTDENNPDEILSRKRKAPSQPLSPELELDLGEHGKLIVKRPSRKQEDIKIQFDKNNIQAFCSYMISEGAQCTDPERRKYNSRASTGD